MSSIVFDPVLNYNVHTAFAISFKSAMSFKNEGDDDDDVVYDYAPAA